MNQKNKIILRKLHDMTKSCSAIVFLCALLLLVPAVPAYADNIEVQPLATATKNGVSVTVTWLQFDAKRVAIEYIISGLKQVDGYQPAGCPIQDARLLDGNGHPVGKGEPTTRCIMDENWNFHVTQSFYDNLASLNADSVNLHFVTTVLNSGQRSAPDAQGNYTTSAGSPIAEFSFDLAATLEEDLTIQQSLAHSVNGVTGLLRSVEFNPSFVASEICLTLPNTADWQPEMALISDQGRVRADSLEILNFKQSKAWTSRNRCYRATFPAALDVKQSDGFQIEVERLVTSLPEVITEAQCNTARDKLAAGTSGIAITCHPAGISYNIEVTQKPADISIDDAYRTATRAFSDVVEGPWTFTVAARKQSQVWCYEVVLHSDGTLSITGHQPPVLKEFPIGPGDQLKARCFSSWSDAASFLSGGKVKLPQDATEKDYDVATETLVVDNNYVISVLFGPNSTNAPVATTSLDQWQTYRHEWLGVELRYPPEWQSWDETSAFVRFAASDKRPLEEAFSIVQANFPIDTVTDFKTDLPVAMTRTITLDNQPALLMQIEPGEQAAGFTSVVFVITPDKQMLTIGNRTVEPALFEKILGTVRFFKSKFSP